MNKYFRKKLDILCTSLSGDLSTENSDKIIYSTDASEYRSVPVAVSRPKNKEDIKKLISFAPENGTHLIPRAAGTSLAGQVVGDGVIVDIGKYMREALKVSADYSIREVCNKDSRDTLYWF